METIHVEEAFAGPPTIGHGGYIAGERAGLLGRLTIEHYQPALADEEHIVTGWRIDTDNRKLIAGTALFSPRNELVAAAKATWFPFPSR